MSRKVMVVAGEASGDRHAAGLVSEALLRAPDLRFFGVGGERLRSAGMEVIHSAEQLSVVGIAEVANRLPAILRVMRDLKAKLRSERPDALLLVDFPDFNLHLAKHAKRAGVPVVYFISPQVWAWRRSRIKKIRRLVSLMLVLFPFEQTFYEEQGVPVELVGHPLVDARASKIPRARARASLGLDGPGPVFGLLPGSRREEVARHLEPMLQTARLVHDRLDQARFVLPIAEPLDASTLTEPIAASGLPVTARAGEFETIVGACDAALAASGTVTLELAVHDVPSVVVYRMSSSTYAIGKLLVDIPHVSLVNLILERRLFPELIQDEFSPQAAAEALLEIAPGGARHDEVQAGLAELRDKLGAGGAYARAGDALVRFLAPQA